MRNSASNFVDQMRNTHQNNFQQSMNQFEQQIYDNVQAPYPYNQNSRLAIPQSNSLVDHFTKGMISFNQKQIKSIIESELRLYNQHQEVPPPQVDPSPKIEQMDMELGKGFVPINYLDFNANSRQLGRVNQAPYSNMNLMTYPTEPTEEYFRQLKCNIDFLGGIEDTVGNMQNSLNNFEIRHLIHKNIRNYPNPFEIKPEAPPPPLPEDYGKPHPFIYNPADDQDRFKNNRTQNIQMMQTIQTQFQQTQYVEEPNIVFQDNRVFQSIEQSKNLREQKKLFLKKVQN